MNRRPLVALLVVLAASSSGGCTIYSVHAQDGTDALPVDLRSSSDDRVPPVGIAAAAATTQATPGVFAEARSLASSAPRRVYEFFTLDSFKEAANNLGNPDAEVRRIAIDRVVSRRFGREQPYVSVYRTTAQFDADGLVRATAVRALNRVRDAEGGAILVAALGDGDAQVRLEAAKALANAPTPAAEVPLRKLAQSAEEDADTRVAAIDALRHYRTLDTQRALVSQLNNANFALAWQSRRSLYLQTQSDFRYDESAWLNYLTTR